MRTFVISALVLGALATAAAAQTGPTKPTDMLSATVKLTDTQMDQARAGTGLGDASALLSKLADATGQGVLLKQSERLLTLGPKQ